MITAIGVNDGKNGACNIDDYSQLITLSQGGRLQQAALDGRLYSVCNQAKVATTAGLATTWTGLGISNPSTSGKNAILHQFGWGMEIASDAAGSIGIMTSDTTGFADTLTIRNCLDGATKNTVMYADDGATIATPVLRRVCGSLGTGATTTAQTYGVHVYNIDGSLILPPGRSALSYTTAATTATLVMFFLWEEVDA